MREILFRGKRLDNGEWVEGHYADEPYTKNTYNRGYILENEKDLFAKLVDLRTVGQYTGLTDKNGKKIFEGDVIRVKYSLRLPAGFGDSIRTVMHDIDFIATVIFDKCRFCLEKADGEVCEMPLDSEAVEVIGNIHDNPELLEEKE